MTYDLMKEITELKKKAAMYDHMASRYDDYCKRLAKIEQDIKELIEEFNPVASIRTRQNSNVNYKEIVDELFTKLQAGIEITTELVMTTYELDKIKASYVMNLLRKCKGIDSRKEGVKVFLYARSQSPHFKK